MSSHTTAEFLYTAVDRPLWKTPETKIAVSFYIAAALMVMLVVVGVARSADPGDLERNGADIVVYDLEEMLAT